MSNNLLQEQFNTVAKHLLTQKVKAKQGVTCNYRTDNGLKCAVGCLIPDDEYKKEFESEILSIIIAQVSTLHMDNISFYSRVQRIHDSGFIENWKEELRKVAKDFELDDSVLEEFE